ncbi:exodeoxyribonuclease III [Candidatus Parcubacteria bacterium]|nr:exodeoxyribonuclease III [Patescibacteria group bacterium]MBU4309470.1 exodeoxyribonuclease III [Patescibacteria group bacterium]MBU4432609.1 exodeoxyribonuclease III [Patescibacteria group bacterium]MBU4577176.1 exodeoxyribonuclease III [Patescibacteria group bacterium]MCG2696824.1 exodeoxyribonuclease III [Candidatus Parcubacteria bacterium]
MKLITWNVNGLRAIVKKEFYQFLAMKKPDALCLQEIKMGAAAIEKENFQFPGYEVFWHPAERPGYSGTATLVRDTLEVVKCFRLSDFGIIDTEGRTQILEFEKFFLVNTYFPNANHELSRLQFKLDFNHDLFAVLKKLEEKKPVVICGDFNVAHEEIDLVRAKENIGSPGFTYEEREAMTGFLDSGFVDVFRELYPDEKEYTWWSYRAGARQKNIGWRIDYFCVSKKFMKKVIDTTILYKTMGSDHCPVLLEVGE